MSDEQLRRFSTKECEIISPEVVEWLQKNVPADRHGNKMWCVGSEDYQSSESCSHSFFFQRRRDAMLFIKTWSKWKKPVRYTQYFTDVRKLLNLETLKYEEV